MPATYDSIASTTLGSNQSSVSFSTIPTTFTDLIIVVQAGNTTDSQAQNIRFNSDSGGNYDLMWLRGSGAAVTGNLAANQVQGYFGYFVVPDVSANDFISTIEIYDYNATDRWKSVVVRDNNAVTGNFTGTEALTWWWKNTAAITNILLFPNGGQFPTGSTFTLYGIKAA